MQNIFGGNMGDMGQPDSGPVSLTAPPLVQPSTAGNVSFGDTNFQMPSAPQPSSDDTDIPYDAGQRMKELYNPSSEATQRFNSMMDQYPNRKQYKPGILQSIAGALAMFGRGGPDMATRIMTGPYDRAVNDWKNQIEPAAQAANYERLSNANQRQLAFQTVAQELRQQAIDNKDKVDAGKLAVMQHRAAIYEFKATHPNIEFIYPKGGTIQYMDPSTKQLVDTKIPVGSMTELDKINLNEKNTLTNIGARGKIAETIQGMKDNQKGWQIVDIPDPDNAGQKISVRMNIDTGQVAPIIYGGKNVSTAQKIGTNKDAYDSITNQTKTMMEGARMLLPHVGELRQQALALEKNNMFGPVMSRIRNLAAKLGTTGTPEQVQASLDEFARAITNDPQLSNDAMVGQFATSLGLMASGMGRVHGGARGGGSIQMINYLKNLLSADSSLSMFNGRLNSVESYLKGYAAGPQTPASSNLDKVLDKLFPPK